MALIGYRLPDDNLKKFTKFIDKLKKAKKSMGVQIGVVKNSTGIDKRTEKDKKITVAEEAYYNCKGVPEKNIPPRNYQQKVIDDNMPTWKKDMAKLLKKHSSQEVCEIMGFIARDATKETINTWKEPPNAPITIHGGWMKVKGAKNKKGKPKFVYIQGKGKDTPLVDFGDLLNSITFQVLGGEEAGK